MDAFATCLWFDTEGEEAARFEELKGSHEDLPPTISYVVSMLVNRSSSSPDSSVSLPPPP